MTGFCAGFFSSAAELLLLTEYNKLYEWRRLHVSLEEMSPPSPAQPEDPPDVGG